MYKYDATHQITGVKYGVSNPQDGYTAETGASRTVTYTYDAVGNRTQVVDGGTATNYTANNLNQYTAVGSNTSYSYSNRGDLAEDGTWTYGHDREGRLISATKTGTTVTYKYDGVGRRIEKNVNGTVTKYVYSGQNLIEERDSSNTVTAKYVYAGGIDNPVKVIKGSDVYYFQQDALGNVTALVDASGDIFESYTYDVFGAPAIKDANGDPLTEASTPFLFTGREYDGETGLYHYRTRAYSAQLGRFLQPDSINFEGGDVNLYRYVHNRVLSLNDPNGTSILTAILWLVDEAIMMLASFCGHFKCRESCQHCCTVAFTAAGFPLMGAIIAAYASCTGPHLILCVAVVSAAASLAAKRWETSEKACSDSCKELDSEKDCCEEK